MHQNNNSVNEYSDSTSAAKPDVLSAASLKERLNNHELWLKTNGAKGTRFVASNENLTGADFRHRDLRSASFNDCILISCSFYDAKLGEGFSGGDATHILRCDLSNALFTTASLKKCFFGDSKFEGCDFSSATIDGAFINGTWTPPVMATASATESELGEPEELARPINFQLCKIRNSSFASLDMMRSQFDGCEIYLVKFDSCRLRNVDFSRAKPLSSLVFARCDLSSADFSGLVIEGSQFTSACLMTRAKFVRTLMKQSIFHESSADFADFTNADISLCTWRKSKAQQSKFIAAGMRESHIEESVFTYSNFDGAQLGGEARTSNFSGVNFENADLHGTDMSGSSFFAARFNENTNTNLVNFSGCTWIEGQRCGPESIGVCNIVT